MDEGFDWFDLNRFGGAPGGGPGTSIEARGCFFGACLFGIARGTNFFGMRIWGFGFGLMQERKILRCTSRKVCKVKNKI